MTLLAGCQIAFASAVETVLKVSLASICISKENDAFDRDEVIRKGLRLKFTQNAALKEVLLATKDAQLKEIGRFDGEYWTNKGENMLGQLLMELRGDCERTEHVGIQCRVWR